MYIIERRQFFHNIPCEGFQLQPWSLCFFRLVEQCFLVSTSKHRCLSRRAHRLFLLGLKARALSLINQNELEARSEISSILFEIYPKSKLLMKQLVIQLLVFRAGKLVDQSTMWCGPNVFQSHLDNAWPLPAGPVLNTSTHAEQTPPIGHWHITPSPSWERIGIGMINPVGSVPGTAKRRFGKLRLPAVGTLKL
jgi:hypothetical protein